MITPGIENLKLSINSGSSTWTDLGFGAFCMAVRLRYNRGAAAPRTLIIKEESHGKIYYY
jgi:hypothetical protein